jgi:hypothetical protein
MHGQPQTVVDGLIAGRGFGVVPVEFENVLVERNRRSSVGEAWNVTWGRPSRDFISVIDLIASRAGRKWAGEHEQNGIARGHTMAIGPKRTLCPISCNHWGV